MKQLKKFDKWLETSFWLYYKWYFLLGVFIGSFLLISLISSLTEVKYDWTVVYAHREVPDAKKSDYITALFEKHATDTTGNGKVKIKLIEVAYGENAETDEERFFLALTKHDCYLMAVDEYIYNLYSPLGYFDSIDITGHDENGLYSEVLGLYITVNKSAPLQYTQEEADESKITEEQLKEINAELAEEHEALFKEAQLIASRVA